MKKFIPVALAATIAISCLVSPAMAHDTGYHHSHNNDAVAAGIFAGILSGILAGTIVSQQKQPRHYRPEYTGQIWVEKWKYKKHTGRECHGWTAKLDGVWLCRIQ